MDEAAMLGRGKHLDEHGYESTYSIMKRHLDKVIEIAEKYGYHVLLWADMLFNSGYGAWGFSGDSEFSQEVVDSFPRNVTLVYWDYSPNKAEHFDQMIAKHKKLADDVWFAGGLYSWYGMIPLNGFSNRSTKETLTACKKLYFLSFLCTGEAPWHKLYHGAVCRILLIFSRLFSSRRLTYIKPHDSRVVFFIQKRSMACAMLL